VLRLSHSAKKIEALGRGDRRYGTQVTVAFGGMRGEIVINKPVLIPTWNPTDNHRIRRGRYWPFRP